MFKLKVVLTVLILAGCYTLNQYMEQKILPNREADLAIQQINEDGSREQMRIEADAQNHWPLVRWGGCSCMVCAVWCVGKKKA